MICGMITLVAVACVFFGAVFKSCGKFRSKRADFLAVVVSNEIRIEIIYLIKKTLSLLLLVFFATLAYSQNMNVAGFRCLENDISARSANVTDINGELCALIRVNTPERGFEFTGCNIEKTEQKTGEIWLFVSPGVKFITIKHRDFGSIINYPFSESIKSGYCYELKLTTARIRQIVEEQIQNQYLIIRSNTPDAKIYINGTFIGRTEVSKALPLGKEHTYRVEAPLYHSKEGSVRLTERQKTDLTIDLEPAFGYLKITTQPESGAEIEINGKLSEGKTPLISDKLPSGVHRVQAFKPMYKSTLQEVQLRDGDTLEVNIDLIPTFANTEIICQDNDAEIYIDDQFKTKGVFKDILTQGKHKLKVTKSSHRTFSKEIDVISGKPFVEKVPNLEPIYGILNIDSNPFDADVYIDGKHYGKTPNQIQRILIGQHTLTLQKEGYKDINETIEIMEGKRLERKYDLVQSASIKISSNPDDVQVEIDGRNFGFTPANITTLDVGTHNLKLSKKGYKDVYDQFTVNTGVNSPLSYTLISADRYLQINSYPSEAAVYIDGKNRGYTPLTIKNEKPGTYKLKLEKYGYEKFEKKITVSEDSYSGYNFDMKRKPYIKPATKCSWYSALDISYINNEYYYGASLAWSKNFWDNFGLPVGMSVTYMTNGNKHEFLTTVSLCGVRLGIGGRADGMSILLGWGFTIKRMIFYVDAHCVGIDVDLSSIADNNDYYYNDYYYYKSYNSSSTASDKEKWGINFGVGYCF